MDKAIPKLRTDLSINLVKDNNQELIVLSDPYNVAESPIVINYEFYMLLMNFDGIKTTEDFQKELETELDLPVDMEKIMEEINKLDEMFFLDSENYRKRNKELYSEFINNPVRPPVCAGFSYSSDKEKLSAELDNLFSKSDIEQTTGHADSVIIPHIDFRVGENALKTYAAAYHAIRNTEADLFVILGTSHYSANDYFMLSEKDFQTPLGITETDREVIAELKQKSKDNFTIDEFAHKPEHSIEFQVLLLQHYFKDRKFKILPILLGSLFEDIQFNSKPEEKSKYKNFVENLNEILIEKGRIPVFISSVDFGHIGRKFGDDFDAHPLLDELNKEDNKLIKSLEEINKDGFFGKISQDLDKWRICGTAPIYAMLSLNNFAKGELLNYSQWDETEANSAVSFASMAFYK